MEKYFFGRIVEEKRQELRRKNLQTLLKKFPQVLLDGDNAEIADFIRLQKVDDKYRVLVVEDAEKRRKGAGLLKDLIKRSWQLCDFSEVVKLSQVALTLDPDDTEIFCFLGRAKWELHDSAGCDIVKEAARRDPKFKEISDRLEGEKVARRKLARKMASGLFTEENLRQARNAEWQSRKDSICGKLAVFFMVSGVVLYLIAVFLAVIIS